VNGEGDRVLVTGATGFIGRALCERLRERGVPFVAAVRTASSGSSAMPEQRVVGDFASAEWPPLLSGVHAVVHLAARAHVMRESTSDPETAYLVANAHVTHRLARAAVEAGVRRFILASTVKVAGEATPPGSPWRGDEPCRPRDAYARSKAQAEAALEEIARGASMEVIVLRLPLTYGPGVRGNFLALLDGVARGRTMPFSRIDNRRSMLFVGNAVSAIEAALQAPTLSGVYAIADDEVVSTGELVSRIGRALGMRSRVPGVPPVMLRIAGLLTGRRRAVSRLLGSLEIDAGRFKQAASWSPPCSMEHGLAVTAAWYKSRQSNTERKAGHDPLQQSTGE
jgi:nucleoside-diphosphate-sugar epimerase